MLPILAPFIVVFPLFLIFGLAGFLGLFVANGRLAHDLLSDRAGARKRAVIAAHICLVPALFGFLWIRFDFGPIIGGFLLLSCFFYGSVAWGLGGSSAGVAASAGALLDHGLAEALGKWAQSPLQAAAGLAAVLAGAAILVMSLREIKAASPLQPSVVVLLMVGLFQANVSPAMWGKIVGLATALIAAAILVVVWRARRAAAQPR